MKLIDYINQQHSIAGESDDQTSYRYTISILPEQVSNPKKGYGEPRFIWTGNFTAHLGDIYVTGYNATNAFDQLMEQVAKLPESNLRDIDRYYRTEPYEDTRKKV